MPAADLDENSLSPHHVLARFLRDSVRCANGIVAAECWMYDPNNGELTRPRGGFYLEQGYLRDISKEALRVRRRSKEAEPSYARLSSPEQSPPLQTLFHF